jgi:endonuclease G, mitochondrial
MTGAIRAALLVLAAAWPLAAAGAPMPEFGLPDPPRPDTPSRRGGPPRPDASSRPDAPSRQDAPSRPDAASWPSACPEHFREGRAPLLAEPKRADLARPLCFRAFAVLHSGRSRGPIYAAEHLTRERIRLARETDRVSEFREEARLPPDERADLQDFVRSGYDRGHMAPSGDMPDLEAQAESFSLANVVPQDPSDNRYLWSDIEGAVRRLVVEEGEAYVVTGPIFEGEEVKALRGRVLVPTHLFKAVYLPGRGLAGAYLVRNEARGEPRIVSLAELRRRAGLEIFPDLPEAARASAAPLPEVRDDGGRVERRPRREDSPWEGWVAAELRRAFRRLWREFWRSLF